MNAKSPEIKHTPGPWAFGAPAHNAFVSIFEEMPEHSAPSHIARIGGVGDSRPVEERDANARLIASAPELLEALKALYSIHIELDEAYAASGDILHASPELLAARAAIAKAEGTEGRYV